MTKVSASRAIDDPEKNMKARFNRFCDFIISGIFFLLFFSTPVFLSGVTSQGIIFDKFYFFAALVLLGTVVWITKGVIEGKMRIRRTPIDIPLLIFWLWYALTAVFSVDRWHSFLGAFGDPSRGFVALTFFILSFYFIITHANTNRVRKALLGVSLAGFLVAVWTLYAILGAPFLPESLRAIAPISLLGSLSALTLYFGALIPILITSIFFTAEGKKTAKKRIVQLGLFATLCLVLACLLLLHAFTPWLIILATITFLVMYVIAQLVRPKARVAWLPLAVFIALLCFLLVGPINIARIPLPVEVSPSTKLSWAIAKNAFNDEFLTGAGPANYRAVFSEYKPENFNENELYTTSFGQSNNFFLEIFTTTGIIGLFLLALIWMLFLGTGFYLLTYNTKETNKILSLGLWSVVVLLFLSSFFVTLNGALLLFFIPLAALAYAALQKEAFVKETYLNFSFHAEPKHALALAFSSLVISAGVLYVFIFLGTVYRADIKVSQGNKALASGEAEKARDIYSKALGSYPEESNYYLRYGESLVVLLIQEQQKGENRDENKMAESLQQAVKAGEVAARLSANDVATIEAVATLYENIVRFAPENINRTGELYAQAASLDPKNPQFSVKQGEIKRFLGDITEDSEQQKSLYTEALNFFETATKQRQDLGAGYYQKAITFSRLNQIDTAITEATKATQYEPSNASYLYTLGALYELRNGEKDRENAVTIYQNILTSNTSIIDVRLSLALLYEKMNDREQALNEYVTALELIKKSDGDTTELQAQINAFLKTVENGGSNVQEAETINPELSLDENGDSLTLPEPEVGDSLDE